MQIDSLDVLNPDKFDPTHEKRGNVIDLTGRVFNRLKVLCFAGYFGKRPRPYWLCECECGHIKSILADNLTSEKTKSCGCKQTSHSYQHGFTSHPLYATYRGMVRRCYVNKADNYRLYGGRGITVCNRWLDDFMAFVEDMGPRPEGYSIERRDNDGNYEPGNCIWGSSLVQSRNKRNTVYITHDGVTRPLTEWSEITGLSPATIRGRYLNGLPSDEILSTEPMWSKGNEVVLLNITTKCVKVYPTLKSCSVDNNLTYSTLFNRLRDGTVKPYRDFIILPHTNDSARIVSKLLKGELCGN